MSMLPDEIWTQILEMGTQTSILSYRDLSCLSISSRRLNRLSNDDALWSTLLTLDFPLKTSSLPQSSTSSFKSLYKTRFERDKSLKLASYRRSILRIESQIAVHSKKLKDLQLQSLKEIEKLKEATDELANLEKVRLASVALNVWQPDIIRGRQKQIVEQCGVPLQYRIGAVEMEIRVCKHQIAMFDKAYKDQKQKLEASKEKLACLKYHPLQEYKLEVGFDGSNLKRKKLKKYHDYTSK